MTTLDILKLVRRWWWVLVLCPLIGGSAAYLISKSMTPIYRAQATIEIQNRSVSGANNPYTDQLARQQEAKTLSVLIGSRPVLEQAIDELGIGLRPGQVRTKLTVAPVRDTQLIAVFVRDASPQKAADLANKISDVFIQQYTAQQAQASGAARDVLQGQIEKTQSAIDATTTQLQQLRDSADADTPNVQAQIAELQSQLNQQQDQLNGQLVTLQQMDINSSQLGSQLRVAEPAVSPVHYVSPRVKVNTALGGILGLLIAAGLVIGIGYLDDTIKNSEDVRELAHTTALGGIPVLQAKEGLEPLQFPRSPATEAYRGVRTNLQFASLGHDMRSVVVTSPRPGDGKTTTAGNLAVVLAQGGQRVILVDADLRKPRVHKLFSGLSNRTGLTNLLLADARADLEPLLQRTAVPDLRILTTGPLPPNPSDVLNSPRMREVVERLEEAADVVLIDCPPTALSDPRITANHVDGVILVTTGGRTRTKELIRAVQEIERTGTPMIGVIVNRTDLEGESYYYYYQSYYNTEIEPPSSDGTPNGTRQSGRRLPSVFARDSAGAEQ